MSDASARPYSIRAYIWSILVCLSILLGSPAWAQTSFSNLAVTPGSGTAGSNGTLNVSVSGTASASGVTTVGDAVSTVELVEGSTVLATQVFEVTYNTKEMPYNTVRTISMQAALGVGTHTVRVRSSLVNGSVSDSGNFTVTVAPMPLVNGATYSSHSAPSQVTAGQSFNITVTMSNSGTKPWGNSGTQAHWLGTRNPENNVIWGTSRIALPSSTVASGATAVFTATLTAPTTTGTYSMQFLMVQEQVEWFGSLVTIPITVVAADPTASFSSPSAGSTFTATGTTATVTFSGSATAGTGATLSSLTLLENAVSFGSTTSSSISASKALSVGQHTIELRATNSANKTTSVYRTVTVNPAPPLPTISVSPLSMALISGQDSTVTWSTTNATSVSRVCTASGTGYAGTVTLAASGTRTETGSSAWVGNPSTCTWTASGAGGNATATQTMTTSTGAPTPSFSSPAAGASFSTTSSTEPVSFSGSATAGSGATLTQLALLENGVQFGTTTSATLTASKALSVGSHTIELRATNSGGNTASVFRTVTVAASVPTITVTPSPMSLIAGQGSTVSWSTTNATSVSRTCTASGTGYSGTTPMGTSGSQTENAVAAWVGYPSTCTWTASNAAGGTASTTQTMTTSTGAPTPSFSSPAAGASFSTTSSTEPVSFSGSATAGSGATLTQLALLENGVQFGTTTSATLTASKALSVGLHTIELRATNSGGNTASVFRTVTVAASVPTITVTPSPMSLIAGQGSTVSWSTTNATSVSRTCTASGTGYSGTTPMGTSGSRTENAVAAWVGYPSTCTWTASNAAGGTASTTQTMTTSTGAPTPSFSSPAAGASFNTTSSTEPVSFSGSATAGSGATLTQLALLENGVQFGTTTSATLTASKALSVGLHTIELRATNSAGNTASVFRTVTVAASVPTITVTPSPMSLIAGQGSTVSWSTTNATSVSRTCTASGTGYSGTTPMGTSGSQTENAVAAWVGYPSTCTWTASNAAGGTASTTQTMTTSTGAPTPSFSSPAAGASFNTTSSTEPVSFSGSATAGSGATLTQLALLENGVQFGTTTSATLTASKALSVGSHTIELRATNSAGNTASVFRTVTVAASVPTITVTPSPMSLIAGQGSTVSWSTTNATSVSRTCTASGTGYSGTTPMGTSGSRTENAVEAWVGYPSTCTWTASNTAGGTASTTQTMTTSTAPDPVANLTAPVHNSYVGTTTSSASVAVNGTASASGGTTVSLVELLDNGVVIDTKTSVTNYSSNVSLAVGVHELKLRVTSSAGKQGLSAPVKVTVYNQVSGNGAGFISQTVPTSMVASRPYSVTVSMLNTGTVTWSEAQQYRLGAQNPQDNRNWNGRAYLTSNVAPGQVGVFTFEVTAPATPNTYNFQWQMLQEGLAWFGDKSTNVAVAVSTGTGPSATLSATPTNVRVTGSGTANIVFQGQGTRSGGTVSKIELLKDAGNTQTVVWSTTGSSTTLAANPTLAYGAGVHRFKLRATDSGGLKSDSAPVIINITNSALLGNVAGVRSNSNGQPELHGWVCKPSDAAALTFKVLLDAPTLAAGAQVLTEGVANVSTELDQSAVASQCSTPGVGHHFKVDLSSYVSSHAGRSLYVWAETADHAQNVTLPCADNNCTMPGTLRVAMSTPQTGDQVLSPNPAFLRMQLTNYSGTYDQAGFYVDGEWVPAAADATPGAYAASKSGLAVRATPYTVYATIRKGNATLQSMPVQFTVVPADTPQLTVTAPSSGTTLTLGTATQLSVAVQGTVQSVKMYANGNLIGNATGSGGSWQMSWTPGMLGSVALTARGYDGNGVQVSVSPAVNVTINAGSGSSAAPVSAQLSAITVPQLQNSEGGSIAGQLVATPNGTAGYAIPLMVPPGTAGMAPTLSLAYDTASSTGSAGLGWNLSGVSSIERCGRTHATDNAPGGVSFELNVDGDGDTEPVDRLCIDGQRLVLVNGNVSDHDAYWATTAEYRTEVESFTRVTTVMNGTQRTFRVESRDGRTAYFGETPDSYINAIGRSDGQAYRWRISRVHDRSGNYMSYLYSEDGTTGENKPLEIRWGGNSVNEQKHYASVRFSYEARPDTRQAYFGGAPNFQDTRLSEVTSYVGISAVDGSGGALAQRYTLAYETSATSGRSLLKSVQACESSVCMPATTFDYGKRSSVTPGFVPVGGPRIGPNLFALGNNGAGSGYAVTPMDEIVVGDFNGDGKADILERYRVSGNSNQQGLWQSNADGEGWTLKTPFSSLTGNLAVMETGDFDGDGRQDILVADWTLGSAASNWRMCWGRDFSDGIFPCNGSITLPSNSWSNLVAPQVKRIVRDVNGDGKDDLLLRGGNGDPVPFSFHKCLSNGSAFNCSDDSNVEITFGNQDDGRPSAGSSQDDMDGDGIPDLVDLGRCVRSLGDSDGDGQTDWICDGVYGGGDYSYIRVGMSTAIGAEWDRTPDNKTAFLPQMPSGSLIGDLNGDGYSDLVHGWVTFEGVPGAPAMQSRYCLSKGNGQAFCDNLPASATQSQDHLVMMVADFDGDGMPDVLRPANDSYNNDVVTGYLLCHLGYSAKSQTCETWAGPTFYGVSGATVLGGPRALSFLDNDYARNRSMFLGDFDGDGKADIATYKQGASWEIHGSADLAQPGEAIDKLVRVTNGTGFVEKAEYAQANSAQVYSHNATPYSGATAQQGKLAQPGQLVQAIHRSNGQGGWLDTEFTYRGNAYDPLRRVPLGFAQLEAKDVQNEVTTTTWFYQNFPYVGMPQYSRSVDRDGTVLLASESTAATRNITQANSTSTRFPYVGTAQLRRKDLDGSFLEYTSVTSTFDDWGNPTLVTRQSYASDSTATPVGTVTTTRTYDNNGTSWRIGEMRTNIEARTMGGSSISRKMGYSYDAAGLLDTETVEPDDALLKVVKTYDRTSNVFGLVNRTILGWKDQHGTARTRTVSDIGYTANGRFVSTRKNALNHSEALQFDARTGSMTQITDANGLVSSAVYDGFGRQLRATAADGTETWTYYKSCSANCPSHAAGVQIRDVKRGAQRVEVPKLVFADAAGHPVRTLSWGFDGGKVVADTEYDSQGRVWRSWQPAAASDTEALGGTVSASAKLDRQFGYDDLGRATSVQTNDEAGNALTSTNTYNGLAVTSTNAKNQQKVETKDEWGRLKTALDANSKLTSYTYDAFNNLKTTTDPLGNVVTITYDKLGRRTELKDPDLGTLKYEVDALGQVWRQSTPNQRAKGAVETYSTRMSYDELGRMTTREAEDHSAGWIYDKLDTQADCTSNRSCGKLVESYTLAGIGKDARQQHSYDSRGRPDVVTTYQADALYTSRTEYDPWGRAIRERHQRGTGSERVFERRYNGYGYLFRIERGAMVLWQATQADAAARITAATLGNGLNVTRSYNPNTGRLSSGLVTKQSATVLQEGYSYDVLGNVSTRSQNWGAADFDEAFTYDALNRLKTSTITGQPEQSFNYDDIGNLISKTGVGTYGYPASGAGSVRPHAVTSIDAGSLTYDANGNLLTAPGRSTPWIWTSFNMPERATKGTAYSDFVYGADHQRLRQSRSDGTVIYYAGAMETEVQGGTAEIKTYWPMGLGVEIERNGATSLSWTHLDRLGSVVAITDETGVVKEQLAYDAWGNRRNLTTATTPSSLEGVVDTKGYTGHEMLDQIDLVHMNGRVYDPLLARFTTADPLIQDATHSQSYNRYSYVWNNPTNLTDPSGFATTAPSEVATVSASDPQNVVVRDKKLPKPKAFCGVTCIQLVNDSFSAFSRSVLPVVRQTVRTWGPPLLIHGSRVVGAAVGGTVAVACDLATYGACAPANGPIVTTSILVFTAGGIYAAEELRDSLDAFGEGTNSAGASVSPPPEGGDGDNNDKQKKGKPERNVDQNKQVNDAARDARLNPKERKTLGRAVEYESRGQGGNLGYKDIREIAELIKKGQY